MAKDQSTTRLCLYALPMLLFAVCGTAAAAQRVSQVRAIVVEPLSLLKTEDLRFGDIATGPSAGSVVIDPLSGGRSVTGGVSPLGGQFGPASFAGAASRFSLVFIQQPAAPVVLTRSGGTQTMQISALTVQNPRLFLINGRQVFEFNVGGTLQVGANQAQGSYVGTFNVTVNYF